MGWYSPAGENLSYQKQRELGNYELVFPAYPPQGMYLSYQKQR
jgi:hypothetical protein